jgi:hypothetical protein
MYMTISRPFEVSVELSSLKKYVFIQFCASAHPGVDHIDARFVRAHRAHPVSVCCARVPEELSALFCHLHNIRDQLDARTLDTPAALTTAVNNMLSVPTEQ